MNAFLLRHHRLLFYACWIFLGLIQSAFTELQDDEAYYWVYGQYLDWGYFDHPPMIGLLVKMGYSIIPHELGVRLFPFILHVLSLVLIEKLTRHREPFLFYTIALSIAVLQLTGFVAVPDIPLIFFTAVFFWCYQRFVKNRDIANSILLGLSIALLFYSKYHAVLVVLFTLLSNIRLLTRYHTYVAAFVALLLFTPHLWWQYQHDWVSFRYHLFESNVNAYRFSFTGDYLLGQVLLPGPLAGFILLPAALLYKTKDQTEKALRFTMIGIYAFFLLSSFRGKVEANWTSPALVPLIILSHQYLLDKLRWRRLLFRLLPVTLLLVLAARVIMILDIVPLKAITERYHSWKTWPEEMKARTKGLPIVFSNSYQRASKYWFYTGQMTYSQNWFRERKNNFNFWPVEDSLLGKPVYFLDKYLLSRFPDSLQTPIGWVGYRYDPSFRSFAKIQFHLSHPKIEMEQGATALLQGTVHIPEHYRRFIMTENPAGDSIRIGLFDRKGWIKDYFIPLSLGELVANPRFEIPFSPGLPRGEYFFRFAVNTGIYNPTHNSARFTLKVN